MGFGLKGLFLALAMLVTGTVNTIATKLQDILKSVGIEGGPPAHFHHPAFQTFCMFIGEFTCLVAYSISKWFERRRRAKKGVNTGSVQLVSDNWKPYIFAIPTCCDCTATTLLNLGLIFTYASVYQMLRGSQLIFTGLFTVFFLRKRLWGFHWLGMFFITVGCSLVGLASVMYDSGAADASNPLLGDVLVVCSQVFSAFQFVVEEKYIGKYDIDARQAVGWEGLWGISILAVVLPIMYFIPGSNAGSLENTGDAIVQIDNNVNMLLAVLGSIFSIAFFNYFGISITKYISSSHRSAIDSCRTLFVWVVSLIVGWEQFHWLQVGGFLLLVFGTFLFNEVIHLPFLARREVEAEYEPVEEEEEEGTPKKYGTIPFEETPTAPFRFKPRSIQDFRSSYYDALALPVQRHPVVSLIQLRDSNQVLNL